jgi:hypothetical protein
MVPFAADADTLDIGTTRIVPNIEAPSARELAPYDAPGTGRVAGRFNLAIHGAPGQLEYRGFKVYLLPAVTWSYIWTHWLALSANLDEALSARSDDGRLEAVVTVGPSGTTNAAIAIAGSDYSGNCKH